MTVRSAEFHDNLSANLAIDGFYDSLSAKPALAEFHDDLSPNSRYTQS